MSRGLGGCPLQYYKTLYVLDHDPEEDRQFFRYLASRYNAVYEEVNTTALTQAMLRRI